MKIINYNKQYLDKDDKKSVLKALNQKFLTGGDNVKKFENKLKNFLKVKHALSCSSGTAGLHLAFESLSLKKDDIVIMPIINFVASYSMANLYKAKIFFADVDSSTGQMTPETLLKCIKTNKLTKIKAVVLMYMGGYPDNVLKFYSLKKKFNFYIVEDACHAFGASYKFKNKNFKIGSCKHSDLCIFSFHPVKTITTGEGGLICTNNNKLYLNIKNFRSHNIERQQDYWNYDISKPAFNYRLSDINCALGISQLKKINFFLAKRKILFDTYSEFFKNYSSKLNFRKINKYDKPCFHLGILNINFKKKNKNKLIKYLNKKKIFPQYHYKPLNLFKFLKKKFNMNLNKFSGAKKYYSSSISLPLYVSLKVKDVIKISKLIVEYLD